MNIKHLHEVRFICRSIVVCIMISLVSCVDNNYDLGNIDKQIAVLGDLTMPLGSTDQITLSEIIDPNDIDILSIVDGNYGISIEESIDASISKAGGEDGISISIDNPTIEPSSPEISDNSLNNIKFETENSSSIASNLTTSQLGSSDNSLSSLMTLNPKYPTSLQSGLIEGVEINNTGFPLSDSDEPSSSAASISTANITTPESVEINSIDQINFGENNKGFTTYLDLDISSISNSFEESSFVWDAPSIQVTLPNGYVLSSGSGSNTITLDGQENISGSSCRYEMAIISYNTPITINGDGTFDDIAADVECHIMDDINIVYGKLNGTSLDSSISIDITSDPIVMDDILLNISNLDLPIAAMNIDNQTTIEDISTNITKIKQVNFATPNNNLEISISPIALPGDLTPKDESDDITILFPTDKYTLDSNDATLSGSNYIVTIDKDEFLSSTGTNKEVGIISLIIDADVVDQDADPTTTNDGVAQFNSSISTSEATISVEGTIWSSDYNSYVSNNDQKNITIKASTPTDGLEVDYAIVEGSGSSFAVNQTVDIAISETIPSDDVVIEQLYGMTFADDNGDKTNLDIAIKIDIEGLPTGSETGDLQFDNYQIILPEFFKAAEDTDGDNIVELTGIIGPEFSGDKNSTIRSYETSLTITNFDFESYSDIIKDATDGSSDKVISIDEVLELKGNISLTDGTISTDDIDITVTPSIEISKVKIGRIEGSIKPTNDELLSIDESVDMSEFSEEMEVDINNIVLSNPTITLNVDNPTNLPFEITTLTITSRKDGKVLKSMTLASGTTIEIAAGDDEADVIAATEIILTSKESSSDKEYQIIGLEELLNSLPDEILIIAKTEIAGDRQSIDLNKDYNIGFNYSVNIPLEFDEFSVSYEGKFEDINSSIEDIIDYIPSLELTLSFESTLPFDINLTELTPVDKSGNTLTLPQIIPDNSVIKGTSSGSAETTDIVISLSDNDDNDMAKLETILINLDANITETNNSLALKENQYIQIGLKVRLPEGITVDLDEEL